MISSVDIWCDTWHFSEEPQNHGLNNYMVFSSTCSTLPLSHGSPCLCKLLLLRGHPQLFTPRPGSIAWICCMLIKEAAPQKLATLRYLRLQFDNTGALQYVLNKLLPTAPHSSLLHPTRLFLASRGCFQLGSFSQSVSQLRPPKRRVRLP